MEGESALSGSIIDELHSSDIQEVQMEGETSAIRNIIEGHHSSDIH